MIEVRRYPEALSALGRGEAIAQQLVAFDESDHDARRRLNIVRLARGQALAAAGRIDEGVVVMTSEIDSRRRRMAADPSNTEAVRDYAISLASLGDAQAGAGRKAEACAVYREGLSTFERIRKAGKLTIFDSENGLKQMQANFDKTCRS
jgi:hypothetical protein